MEGIFRHAKDSLLGREGEEREEQEYGSGTSGHGGRPGDIGPRSASNLLLIGQDPR
jgi:hypothetical protein